MLFLALILADAGIGDVIFRSLVLMVIVIVALYGVLRLRRWLNEDDDEATAKVGFTLSDLRELHRRGEMTTEEFEKARAQMLAAGKSMTQGIDPLARPDGTRPRRNAQ